MADHPYVPGCPCDRCDAIRHAPQTAAALLVIGTLLLIASIALMRACG